MTLICLLCNVDCLLFYFRELETELLLVATHFIEKDKDLRLPRTLKVGVDINDSLMFRHSSL